jgi:hypothetical protein
LEHLQKQNLVQKISKSFHNTKEGIKQILLTTNNGTGELAVIDPSAIGVHLKTAFDVVKIPFFNRVYRGRWICGTIGILLLLALICLIFIKDFESVMNPKYKKIS